MQPALLAKIVERFEDLAATGRSIKVIHYDPKLENIRRRNSPLTPIGHTLPPLNPSSHPDEAECRGWIVQAGAALADVFPERHAARVSWDQLVQANPTGHINSFLDRLRGVFDGAMNLVRQGYVGTLIESIQADTLVELLDRADGHLAQGLLIEAVGIAGGVLETHLRHLVDRHNLAVQGHGSIEKYNSLIAQERKAGNEIYSLGDQKLITAWGDPRNTADHDPLRLAKSKEEVSLMLQGIRNFLSRVP